MAQTDRDVLFANEAFVIGMLQAVSGGAVVAALAQGDTLSRWAGHVAFLLLVTFALVSLALSILAAYWRHQYKMWDVKAQASQGQGKSDEAASRSCRASVYLWSMRYAVVVAVMSLLFALIQLVVNLWRHEAT